MVIGLTKNFREAAEGLLRLLKNGTQQESQEGGKHIIAVIGDWQALDIDELDVWGGHLKFVLRDNEAKTSEELAERGAFALDFPELASLATSKTLLTVYREIQEEDHETWRDVTREFALKASRYAW